MWFITIISLDQCIAKKLGLYYHTAGEKGNKNLEENKKGLKAHEEN